MQRLIPAIEQYSGLRGGVLVEEELGLRDSVREGVEVCVKVGPAPPWLQPRLSPACLVFPHLMIACMSSLGLSLGERTTVLTTHSVPVSLSRQVRI